MTPMLLTLHDNTTVALDAEDILVVVTKAVKKTPKAAATKLTEISFKCRDVAVLVKETPLQVYAKLAELLNIDLDDEEPAESDDEAGDIHCPNCGDADWLACTSDDDPSNRLFHCGSCDTHFSESEAE